MKKRDEQRAEQMRLLLDERAALLGFARLLASYGCADDCAIADRADDDLCGPCSAARWLEQRGLQRQLLKK